MRAICKLANASTLISGVEFAAHPDGGMVSRALTPEEAVRFDAIPGYTLIRDPDPDQSDGAASPSEEPVAAKRVYTRRKPL